MNEPTLIHTDLETRAKWSQPPSVIDHSMFSSYLNCPREFYFRFIRGLVPIGTPDFFISGRAWGAMLRIWHGTEGTPAERKHLAVRSMLEVYATTPSGGPIDEARGPANLQKLFDIYTSRYIEEPWRVLEAEIGFKIPLSDGLTIAGAIDAMIEWPSIGMLVREDKTTKGWLSEYYMKSWTRHFQPTFYVWALDQLRGDTVGCLMNCAQLVIPKKGPSENQFMRSPEMKTREELREFEHLIIEVHCRIIDDWKFWQDSEGAPNTWPKLGRFCFGGYGLRECTWASICKSTPQRRLGDISIDHYTFQETEWKPWDRKGED